MTLSTHAQSGYAAAAEPTRTPRSSEYSIFAKITHRLKSVDETDNDQYPELASALLDNQRLWGALFEDLSHENNALPHEMRAQLISLAEFVRKHTQEVLYGRDSAEVLIDINTSIMRGLRGDTSAEDAA